MPIYEYRCQECGEEFEKLVRSISSAPETTNSIECPHCGGKKVKKAFSLFGTQSSSSGGLSTNTCAPSG